MTCCFACARAGDDRAVTDLVDHLRPRLTKMSAYYARRTGEDPDDLLQEAWQGLLEALPQLDLHIGSPEHYLIQRARWRLLDSVKRARLRRCAALDEAMHLPAAPDRCEESAHVSAFSSRLKPVQRAILGYLLEGFTWREAGDALGCTSANIAYHVRQIRREYEHWAMAA